MRRPGARRVDGPLVLVSAGIGITPIAAIVEDLSRRQPDRQVRIFHADTSHSNHALYAHLRRQVLAMGDAKAQNWYEEDAESAPTLHPPPRAHGPIGHSDPLGRDGIHVRSAAVHADDPERPCSTRASPPSVSTTKSSAPTCGPRTPTTWRAPVAEVVSTLVREPTETQMRLAYTGRVTGIWGKMRGGSRRGAWQRISEWGRMAVIPTRLERTLLGWGRVAAVPRPGPRCHGLGGMGDGNPGVDPRPPGLAADDAVDGSVAGGFGVGDPGALRAAHRLLGVGRAGLGGRQSQSLLPPSSRSI